MAFKAEQRTVNDLLLGSILEIPRNQRRYVWKEEHWKDLLDDLKFSISLNDVTKKHFIGSIVLKEEKAINGISHFTIIDGQQRTFTLILFLAAIMILFKEREMENDFRGTSKLLIVTDLKNQSFCILNSDFYINLSYLILQICNWNNETNINNLINTFSKNSKLEKPLINCISFYYNSLKDFSNDEILQIRDSLLETKFVEIIATTEEDSYTIFEILNARGQILEDHELLKNFIMRYILPQEQTKIDEVKIKWTEEIDKGLGKNINKFFKHYTTHKYQTSKKDNIYKTIHKGIPDKNVNSLFYDILQKVDYYKTILNPVYTGESKNCSKNEYQILSFFKRKKAEQFRPIILSLMSQKYNRNINEEKYENTLYFLYKFFICYNVIGEEKSNKLEDPIYKYSPILENDYSEENLYAFIESLNKRLPNEEIFINSFKNIGWSNHTAYYNDSKNKDRVKIVLEILEYNKSGKELEDYTLEHILPDSQNENNAQIGNILPLEKHLNEKCKDLPLDKKIKFYEQSYFTMTRNFVKLYDSNEKLLNFDPQKRTIFLAKYFYQNLIKGK